MIRSLFFYDVLTQTNFFMTLRTFFASLISIALIAGCSGPEKLTVSPQGNAPTVDGSLSNWNTTETLVKSTEEIEYYATTHGNNLYLFINVKAPMKNYAIRQSGLIVYLNNSEDNRKRSGLAYPPGILNLLRQYPGAFDAFTTEMDWGSKPENQDLITSLSEDLFSSIMIVERPPDSNDASYGFIDKSQLEIDGFEIAADENQRYITVEMKITLGETSIFKLEKENLWLGFSIEPPEFHYQDPNSSLTARQERYTGRQRRRPSASSIQYAMRRNLGQSQDWFLLNLE